MKNIGRDGRVVKGELNVNLRTIRADNDQGQVPQKNQAKKKG